MVSSHLRHTKSFNTHGHLGFSLDKVTNRLIACGLPKSASVSISRLIQKWFSSNGPVWTINRLKLIKQQYVNVHAEVAGDVPWLKLRNRLFTGCYSAVNRLSFRKALNVLNIHKMFVFKRSTPDQVRKHTRAILTSGEYDLTRFDEMIQLGYIPSRVLEKQLSDLTPTPLTIYPVKDTYSSLEGIAIPYKRSVERKRKVVRNGRMVRESYNVDVEAYSRSEMIREAVKGTLYTPLARLYKDFPGILYPLSQRITPGFSTLSTNPLSGGLKPWKKLPYVGCIGGKQEEGGKLRIFANPLPVYQCAMADLESILDEFQKHHLPTDYRYNQDKGARQVQAWIREGRLVTSFDLSSATDRFPYSSQIKWMRELAKMDERLLRVFGEVSKGTYRVSDTLVRQGFPPSLVWAVGQPLGMRGSFQAFSITHSFLVRGIEKSLYGKCNNLFAIVGDDIVIADSAVAKIYLDLITSVGCEISLAKSLPECYVAEFAGFTITKKAMNKSGKHKKVTPASASELGKILGPSSRDELERGVDPSWVDVLSKLPSCVGGLSWHSECSFDYTYNDDVYLKTVFDILTRVRVPSEVLGKDFTRYHCEVLSHLGVSLKDMTDSIYVPIPEIPIKYISVPEIPSKFTSVLMSMPQFITDSLTFRMMVDRKNALESAYPGVATYATERVKQDRDGLLYYSPEATEYRPLISLIESVKGRYSIHQFAANRHEVLYDYYTRALRTISDVDFRNNPKASQIRDSDEEASLKKELQMLQLAKMRRLYGKNS